jgi:hypothetical protein
MDDLAFLEKDGKATQMSLYVQLSSPSSVVQGLNKLGKWKALQVTA